MKKDLFREIWRQKGALLREFASRAKLVTPRTFLTEPIATSSYAPSGSLTPAQRKWRRIFQHSRPATPMNTHRADKPSTPPESESTQTSSDNPIIHHPTARDSSPEPTTQSEGSHARKRSLLRKRPPMEVKHSRA